MMADPRATYDRFFPAMFAQDRAALRELFTQDVTWHVPPSTRELWGDPSGVDTVIGFLCDAGGEYFEPGSFVVEPELELVTPEGAVMVGRMRARTAKGADYSNEYAFAFRLRDARICEVWEVLDTAHFQAQMA